MPLKKYVISFPLEALLCLCFIAWKKLCIDKNKEKMVGLCDKGYQKIQRAWRYQILEEIMLRFWKNFLKKTATIVWLTIDFLGLLYLEILNHEVKWNILGSPPRDMYIASPRELFSSTSSQEGRLIITVPMDRITDDLKVLGFEKLPQIPNLDSTFCQEKRGRERQWIIYYNIYNINIYITA